MMAYLKKHLAAILLLVIGAGVLTGGYFLLLSHTNKVARDFERLSDMHIIRSGFAKMFQSEASYASAKCNTGDVAHFCTLGDYDRGMIVRQDPSGLPYTVTGAPSATAYQISFTLERGYGTLGAGDHTLSEKGIQ